MRAFCATRRITPLASYFLKPWAVMVTLYEAGAGSAGTAYSPSELVVVVRVIPRSALETSTCALATTAPDESRTLPFNEAVSWARMNAAERTSTPTAIPHSRRTLIADSFSPIRRRPMPDAFHQHHQRSIFKNGKMPLLKRINSASGVCLCQEKMHGNFENSRAWGPLPHVARRFAHDQLGDDSAVNGAGWFFFQTGVDGLEHERRCGRSHNFHGLAHGGQRGRIDGGGRDVVKAHNRALIGNANPRFR